MRKLIIDEITELEEIIPNYTITNMVNSISDKIIRVFSPLQEEVILVGVVSGCIMFFKDLLAKLAPLNPHINFIKISTKEKFIGDINLIESVNNKHVIIVDTIIDTGYTLRRIADFLSNANCKSIASCILIDRPHFRLCEDLIVNFRGITLHNSEFLVGYGLDLENKYRTLGSIYKLNKRR